MIFNNLDSNGDWTFGRGIGDYVDLNAAIGLNIRTRLYSWVGDCFFDKNAGIDWKNRLGTKNQQALLEAELRRVILQSFGVTGLVSVSTQLNDRLFTASYSVNTIYSTAYEDSLTLEL